ncbi:sigma-54-dependent transcriptional regulator [Ferrimonas aestuarii]|uniref:Sigma-54-dependent Fis family transcriptional regulator n=1 Tax=Ferrimonas aestuarii TaxID=2569539 RepID=A0A4U1BPC4_9GAMM|nr:sigma 54-interacting transcriptional regulator [Ferrimonas aestuarii]TKB56048.1 sigma-54-dependent Fis family transcriptional regulator [Ferrimonas aestuarii]
MKTLNTLILDDEPVWVDNLSQLISELPVEVNIIKSSDPKQCASILESVEIDLILLDLMMPDINGLQIINEVHCLYPNITLVVVSGMDNLATAVECMRAGASDFLVKGSETELLQQRLQTILEKTNLEINYRSLVDRYFEPNAEFDANYASLISRSPKMQQLIGYAKTIEHSHAPILIQGETGTGKMTLARCLGGEHAIERLHCHSDSQQWLQQLLGYSRGYQGFGQPQLGLLHKLQDGYLVLSQVELLDSYAQSVLFELLNHHHYSPLGTDAQLPIRTRIICTTLVDLQPFVDAGKFRADLYYKLSVHRMRVPPLRERTEDLELLVPHLLQQLSAEAALAELPNNLYELLRSYPFPGNISELSALLTEAWYQGEEQLSLQVLTQRCKTQPNSNSAIISHKVVFPNPLPTLTETNELLIKEALNRCNGSQKDAAALLGLSPAALCRRIAKL